MADFRYVLFLCFVVRKCSDLYRRLEGGELIENFLARGIESFFRKIPTGFGKLGTREDGESGAEPYAGGRFGIAPASIKAIDEALDFRNERMRWGATRIFNQHFKYLSEEWSLGSRLQQIATKDPAATVKMAAAQSLYQWWYWDRSVEHKAAIEQTLIAGLGREEHPWARRAFIETYYGTLDDNVRFLYGSWVPRLKRPEDRKAVEQVTTTSSWRKRFASATR